MTDEEVSVLCESCGELVPEKGAILVCPETNFWYCKKCANR